MDTDEVRLWHDQVIYKDGRHGGRVDWHQDYYYWQHLDRPDSVTSWAALTDSTVDNGCVWVIPGSHRAGVRPDHTEDGYPFGDTGDAAGSELLGAEAVALELRPGDVSFHHCLTLHGSGENSGPHPRFGYITHYLPRGVRYRREHDRVREHEVDVADGDIIAGDRFPILHIGRPKGA